MTANASGLLNIFHLESNTQVPSDHWEFPVNAVIQIGRQPDNDVVIRNMKVSRSHATVFHDGRNWHCSGFGSNGIMLGGIAQAHVVVKNGTTIQFASSSGPRLMFQVGNDDTEDQIRGSVTFLIDEMKDGSPDSQEKLWARCFATIVRVARQRLGSAPRRVSDEEDVAVGVFNNLFRAGSEGRLPKITDRESLWRLLISMTANSAKNAIRDERREKRGGGRVRGESIADLTHLNLSTDGPSALDNLIADQPTPDSIVAIDELIRQWLDRLPDDEHRKVALLRLEGYTNEEISNSTKISLRTVERRIKKIREVWKG
jgi:RNA polymerase sigma factor (sigma-70 family)